jgi:riboflavin biosynthesis pyrimidine reductase
MRRIWPQPDPGVLDESGLIEAYRLDHRARPQVRVNFVMGLDGAMVVEGQSRALSSPEDRHLLGLLRMLCDVLLVGAGTVRAENIGPLRLDSSRQRWRREHGLAENPTLAIVSGGLDLPFDDPCLVDAPVRPVVLTTEQAPADRRAAASAVADVITVGHTIVEPDAAVAALADRGLGRVLCEGGPQLFSSLIAADQVDEMCLTVSPVLAGAGAGRMSAGVPTPELRRLRLRQVLLADDGLLYLRYGR